MRLILSLALAALVSGCATTMAPIEPTDNCSFWENRPYNFGQKQWREFDCQGAITYSGD